MNAMNTLYCFIRTLLSGTSIHYKQAQDSEVHNELLGQVGTTALTSGISKFTPTATASSMQKPTQWKQQVTSRCYKSSLT